MGYPKSEDKKIQKITDVFIKYADMKGLGFSFGGSELYPVEAFSDFGGLSLFLNEAKDLYNKLFTKNYTYSELMSGLGRNNIILNRTQIITEEKYFANQKEEQFPVFFLEREEGTFFGFVPAFNDNIESNFNFVVHLAFYSLEECIKKAKEKKMDLKAIPLDSLYEKMVTDISCKKLLVIKNHNDLSINNVSPQA